MPHVFPSLPSSAVNSPSCPSLTQCIVETALLERVVARYSCVLSRSQLLFSIFKPHAEISQPGLTEHGFAAAVALRLLRAQSTQGPLSYNAQVHYQGRHYTIIWQVNTISAQLWRDSIVMIAPITLGRRQHPNMQAGLPWH